MLLVDGSGQGCWRLQKEPEEQATPWVSWEVVVAGGIHPSPAWTTGEVAVAVEEMAGR